MVTQELVKQFEYDVLQYVSSVYGIINKMRVLIFKRECLKNHLRDESVVYLLKYFHVYEKLYSYLEDD